METPHSWSACPFSHGSELTPHTLTHSHTPFSAQWPWCNAWMAHSSPKGKLKSLLLLCWAACLPTCYSNGIYSTECGWGWREQNRFREADLGLKEAQAFKINPLLLKAGLSALPLGCFCSQRVVLRSHIYHFAQHGKSAAIGCFDQVTWSKGVKGQICFIIQSIEKFISFSTLLYYSVKLLNNRRTKLHPSISYTT